MQANKENQNNKQVVPIFKNSLASCLTNINPEAPSPETFVVLSKKMVELSPEMALDQPKLFQIGKDTARVQILTILAYFNEIAKVKEKLQGYELLILAGFISEKYSHDSVEDILLAFKDAIFSGRQFYNKLSIQDISDVLGTYFEKKATMLENAHKARKFQESSDKLIIAADAQILQSPLARQSKQKQVQETLQKHAEWREEIDYMDQQRKEIGVESPNPPQND